MILKVTVYAMNAMCIFMMIVPIIEYNAVGKITAASGLYIPFVTEYDVTMFVLLSIYNYLMILGAACTEIPVVTLTYMAFINVHMLSRMLVYELRELQTISKLSEDATHKQIVNIIHMQWKYNE